MKKKIIKSLKKLLQLKNIRDFWFSLIFLETPKNLVNLHKYTSISVEFSTSNINITRHFI